MTLHKEIHFETDICECLAAYGWFYHENERHPMIGLGRFFLGFRQQDRFGQFTQQRT